MGLPFVLVVSIPFAAFAALTTYIALGILLIRLVTVYMDLGIALVQSAISPSTSDADAVKPALRSPDYEAATRAARRSISTPPRNSVGKRSSFASLVGTGTDRDYEGVGGWRLSENAEDEALWMKMNSRLELPAASSPIMRHKRSSIAGSHIGTPEHGRSPSTVRVRTPGTASPEGYFSMQPMTGNRDAATLGIARVSFDDRPRSSAVSSTDSLGSKFGSRGSIMRTSGVAF